MTCFPAQRHLYERHVEVCSGVQMWTISTAGSSIRSVRRGESLFRAQRRGGRIGTGGIEPADADEARPEPPGREGMNLPAESSPQNRNANVVRQ